MIVLDWLLDSDPAFRWQVCAILFMLQLRLSQPSVHRQPSMTGGTDCWRYKAKTASGLEARAFRRGTSTGATEVRASLESPPC
jgi:hypothetical protein